MKRITAIIIILIMFSGCRTLKVKDTSIIKDSINEKTKITLIKSSVGIAKLQNPCDEDGNLRPIFYESSSGGLKTTVKDENGAILIAQEQKTDTIYKEKLVYQDKLIFKDKLVEVEVKNPLNLKLLIYSILATIWILRKPLLRLINPIK